VEATCEFYSRLLGLEPITFAGDRCALTFGNQKINLHPSSTPVSPHALHPQPGSADLCFVTDTPITDVVTHLQNAGVTIEQGPVRRTGATGPITSVYFRDPDSNLIEVAQYLHGSFETENTAM
jgi:catechol 2,3-dioxygenase-like lactoylglutathione lyase family enzyme